VQRVHPTTTPGGPEQRSFHHGKNKQQRPAAKAEAEAAAAAAAFAIRC